MSRPANKPSVPRIFSGMRPQGAMIAACCLILLPHFLGALAFAPPPLCLPQGGSPSPPVAFAASPCKVRGRDSLLTIARLNRAKKNAMSNGNDDGSPQVSSGLRATPPRLPRAPRSHFFQRSAVGAHRILICAETDRRHRRWAHVRVGTERKVAAV